MDNFIDYYELLQVHPKASDEIIKKAYLVLVKRYHPDVSELSNDEAHEKIKLLNKAYETLANPNERRKYDDFLSYNRSSRNTNENQNEDEQKINLVELAANEKLILTFCNSFNNFFFNQLEQSNKSYEEIFQITTDAYNEFNKIINPLMEKQIILSKGNHQYLKISFLSAAQSLTHLGNIFSKINATTESNLLLKRAFTYAQFDKNLQNDIQNINKNNTNNSPSQSSNFIIRFLKEFPGNPILLIAGLFYLLYQGYDYLSPKKPYYPPPKAPVVSQSANDNSIVPTTPPASQKMTPPKVISPPQNIITQYVPNQPILKNTGLSSIEVDNSRNSYPVLVKLFHLSSNDKKETVRTFTIRQGEKFKAENITSGTYDIRYKILSTDETYKSKTFSLKEISTSTGTHYSVITLTLYTVQGGNTRLQSIPKSDFE